jgi:ribosomal-protein-serine acetyltransferase
VLRGFVMDDVDAMFTTVQAHRASLLPWLPWAEIAHQDRADTEAWISAQVLNDQHPLGAAGTSVGLFCDGVLAGGLSLHDLQVATARCDIGYWLAPPFRRRGLMTEAVRHWLSYLFADLGLRKVGIRCAGGNAASAAIPRRIGIPQEGCLRQHRAYAGIGIQDELLFGVLTEEWDPVLHDVHEAPATTTPAGYARP